MDPLQRRQLKISPDHQEPLFKNHKDCSDHRQELHSSQQSEKLVKQRQQTDPSPKRSSSTNQARPLSGDPPTQFRNSKAPVPRSGQKRDFKSEINSVLSAAKIHAKNHASLKARPFDAVGRESGPNSCNRKAASQRNGSEREGSRPLNGTPHQQLPYRHRSRSPPALSSDAPLPYLARKEEKSRSADVRNDSHVPSRAQSRPSLSAPLYNRQNPSHSTSSVPSNLFARDSVTYKDASPFSRRRSPTHGVSGAVEKTTAHSASAPSSQDCFGPSHPKRTRVDPSGFDDGVNADDRRKGVDLRAKGTETRSEKTTVSLPPPPASLESDPYAWADPFLG